jgi:TrbL/VirB6 plasmid conjugal transfer protein
MMVAPGGLPCPPIIGCNPAGPLIGAGAGAIAKSVFDAFTSWIAEGTAALLGRVGALITPASAVKLDAPAFTQQFGRMRDVAMLLVVPMLLAAVISAVMRRDPGRLMRTVGAHLPLAVLGSFVAIELTQIGMAVTDELCTRVTPGDGTTEGAVAAVLRATQHVSVSFGPAAGGFVSLLAMLLVSFGAMLIWLELLVRTSAIYVAVLFLPVVLAGLVWPATAQWTRRLIELLLALVLSKFVIVAVLGLGTALMADTSDHLGVMMAGAAVMLMASFTPFALLRMVPLVEATVIGHLEGMERRPFAAGAGAAMTGMQIHGQAQAFAAGAADRSTQGASGSTAHVLARVDGGDLDRDAGRQTRPLTETTNLEERGPSDDD